MRAVAWSRGERLRRKLWAITALVTPGVLAGCTSPEPLDRPRLEVVAVQADPPSGSPGTDSQLALVHSDMVLPNPDDDAVIDPSGVQVAWFGGCHNPPSGQYYGCLPGLRAIAEQLPSPIPEVLPEGAVPVGIFGVGPSFALSVPEDILTETNAGLTGVSFAFFAVCRGELHPRPELEDTVPLGCYGEDGEARTSRDFVVGFTTVRTAPGQENANPEVIGMRLDGVALERGVCTVDDDCAALGGGELPYRCGSDGECWPVLPSCDLPEEQCEPLELELVLDPESAEPLPSGTASRPRETLRGEVWSVLSFDLEGKELYAGSGAFAPDTKFWVHPLPPDAFDENETLPLVAVVRDGRGGTGLLWWQFLR